MRVVLDLEANGLKNPDKIHCIVCRGIDNGRTYKFVAEEVQRYFAEFAKGIRGVVGHNLIDYDLPVVERCLGIRFPQGIITDSLILSRLLDYRIEGGHSLEAWGTRLKHPKVGADINDWSQCTPEIVARCENDVLLNEKLYYHLMEHARISYKDRFQKAIEVEHQIAHICQDMKSNGFKLDYGKATALVQELSARIEEIDKSLQEAFPPKETIKVSPVKGIERRIVTPFNPASPKQIVERLDGFWTPGEKTEKGQAKVNEANLATLKEGAPEACRRLVERLLLAGRLNALRKWITLYDPSTGRVHPTFIGLGTWTHRMAHKEPNLGNIAAPKSIKYKGKELAKLATDLGGRMRELWGVEEGSWLVGTDAEGIQLRIFAHYLESEEFVKSVLEGKKEDGTDPHSRNAKLLGIDRDGAKTFIYAYLLGAGNQKLGAIIGGSRKTGAAAHRRFTEGIPGLAQLKNERVPKDAARGYFEGLDGRLIKCDSEHHMLAGYLQTGEACIMKHANVLWRSRANAGNLGIAWRQVNFVHDEWQTEVRGTREEAEAIGRLQADSIRDVGEAFALNCPMAGGFRVGKNWLATH